MPRGAMRAAPRIPMRIMGRQSRMTGGAAAHCRARGRQGAIDESSVDRRHRAHGHGHRARLRGRSGALEIVAAIASAGSKSLGRDIGELAGVRRARRARDRRIAAGSRAVRRSRSISRVPNCRCARSTCAARRACPSSSAPPVTAPSSKRGSPRRRATSRCWSRLTPRWEWPWRRSWCASRRRRCRRTSTSRSSRRITSTRWMRPRVRRWRWRTAPRRRAASIRTPTP